MQSVFSINIGRYIFYVVYELKLSIILLDSLAKTTNARNHYSSPWDELKIDGGS